MAITFPNPPIIIPSNTHSMQLHAELYPSAATYGPNPDFTNKPLANDVLKAWNDAGMEYQDSCTTSAKVPGDIYATPYSYTDLQLWNPTNSTWEDLELEINKWDSTKVQLQADLNPYDPNTEAEQYNNYYRYSWYGYIYNGYGLKNFKRFNSRNLPAFEFLTSFKNFTDAKGDSTLDSYWNGAQSYYHQRDLTEEFPEHFGRNTLSSCDTSLSVFLRFKTSFNKLKPETFKAQSTAYSSAYSEEYSGYYSSYCWDGDPYTLEFRQSALITEVVGFRVQIGGCLHSAKVYSAIFDMPKEQIGTASLNMWSTGTSLAYADYGYY